MVKIDSMSSSDFLIRNYYVTNSLQGWRKVVHLDEIDFDMLQSSE